MQVWGEQTARDYDRTSAFMFTPEVLDPAVDFLAARADGGPALEFAVGTGRVALPLSERGLRVAGIELSEPMVAQLRAKPGGAEFDVTVGDMAITRVPGEFGLVYLVFNTITNLLTQDQQVACFRNAARHLRPGGRFVIEVGVPRLRSLPPGETAHPFHLGEEHVGFDTYDDLPNQRMRSHHYRLTEGHANRSVGHFRFVWPSELDLMAKLAGLRRSERWEDWRETPFTGESGAHVSVWRKPEA